MRIIRTTFLTLLAIFLLSGCGMPTYHDFDSLISITYVSSAPGIDDVDYITGFRVNINWDGDSYLDNLDASSPSVLLMYTIAPERGSLSSNFNRVIGGSNNYNNGMTANFNDNGQLEGVSATTSGQEIMLYAFENELRSLSTTPTYTYGPLLRTDGDGTSIPYYYFMIRRENSADGLGFYFILDIYTGDGTSSTLVDSIAMFRSYGNMNNLVFPNSIPAVGDCNGNDFNFYASAENNDDPYQVSFSIAVNMIPGAGGTHNNIFWSDLRWYRNYTVQ